MLNQFQILQLLKLRKEKNQVTVELNGYMTAGKYQKDFIISHYSLHK